MAPIPDPASLLSRFPELREAPAIGILRGCPPENVTAVAGAAIGAGLVGLEVTFDSERAGEQISRIRRSFPDVVVGAGTVVGRDQLEEAAERGAAFVVAPVVDEEVIHACLAHGVPCLPGAATATEVWRAHRAGAIAVKVSPAEQLGGPAYLRALRAPLGNVPMVPTGGVDAGNARAYLEAGAVAVGVGSSVFSRKAMEAGDVDAIASAASEVVGALR